MGKNIAELPFLKNLGLMLTYRCPVACPHCIVEAGPARTEEFALDQALSLIAKAEKYRNHHIRGLAFTGGEPFLDRSKLEILANYGREHGFIISVVSNAFWASTKEKAFEILTSLPAVGAISFSTDRHHLKSIPFGHIKNAVWAAQELDLPFNVALCTDNEEDSEFTDLLAEVANFVPKDGIRVAFVFPLGRGRAMRGLRHKISPKPSKAACSMASSPVVFPDGSVIACIGPVLTLPKNHPLYLGNIFQEDLAVILDRAEENPVLHAIRAIGPWSLLEWGKDFDFSFNNTDNFIENCACDVCFKIFSHLPNLDKLKDLAIKPEFQERVAYARAYYLNETCMVKSLKMNRESSFMAFL